MKHSLLQKINKVELLTNASKLARLFKNPYKYIHAQLIRFVFYKINKKEKILSTELFFDNTIKIALPSSTDIYLTGAKSHSSEIRLAKYLIHTINEGNSFLDIGAHVGYFSILVSVLLKNSGKIISVEPSEKTYKLLFENCTSYKNIKCINSALSNISAPISFYEFPSMYSEYNATDITQYEKQTWYKNYKPTKKEIIASTIDILCDENNFIPDIIKIDVEGAELQVIEGAATLLKKNNPIIIMEYIIAKSDNYINATNVLCQHNYQAYIIDSAGQLVKTYNIEEYMQHNNRHSENIVFCKK